MWNSSSSSFLCLYSYFSPCFFFKNKFRLWIYIKYSCDNFSGFFIFSGLCSWLSSSFLPSTCSHPVTEFVPAPSGFLWIYIYIYMVFLYYYVLLLLVAAVQFKAFSRVLPHHALVHYKIYSVNKDHTRFRTTNFRFAIYFWISGNVLNMFRSFSSLSPFWIFFASGHAAVSLSLASSFMLWRGYLMNMAASSRQAVLVSQLGVKKISSACWHHF